MDVPTATASPPRWIGALKSDPLPWLLGEDKPAVRYQALRDLLDLPDNDPCVRAARSAAMETDPIAAILAAQVPDGYWVKPGAGYGPKYRGTVWQVIFLDQLGADPADERVRAACEYVLTHTQTVSGGFGILGGTSDAIPGPSRVVHCLNGNLLRALIGFGRLDDPRVQRAVDWQARSITGEDFSRYYALGTTGPGFACAINEGFPCAWGGIKALRGLAAIPLDAREPHVRRAIDEGAEFLLSRDPAKADYPAGWGNAKPNASWFRLGFPSGYVADVLQNLEVLCELGRGGDPRLQPAIAWLLAKQDEQGRWKNQYAYNGKTWVDFEPQGQPSKWVTLRACRVLKTVVASIGTLP
jgi:hypothetical protein